MKKIIALILVTVVYGCGFTSVYKEQKNQDIISLMMILGLGYYTYFMIIASISQYYAHKQPPFTKFEKFAHDNGLITFVGFYGLIIKYCCSKH